MSEFKARIGRIRMKNGGADVRLFPQAREIPDRRGELMRHARKIVDFSITDDALVGHVVIGLFAKGGASVATYYDKDTCPIPRVLIPSMIEELLRRDLVTDPECEVIFDRKFEWRDGPTG